MPRLTPLLQIATWQPSDGIGFLDVPVIGPLIVIGFSVWLIWQIPKVIRETWQGVKKEREEKLRQLVNEEIRKREKR